MFTSKEHEKQGLYFRMGHPSDHHGNSHSDVFIWKYIRNACFCLMIPLSFQIDKWYWKSSKENTHWENEDEVCVVWSLQQIIHMRFWWIFQSSMIGSFCSCDWYIIIESWFGKFIFSTQDKTLTRSFLSLWEWQTFNLEWFSDVCHYCYYFEATHYST